MDRRAHWCNSDSGAAGSGVAGSGSAPALCLQDSALGHASALPCSHKVAALALGTVVQINIVYSLSRKN